MYRKILLLLMSLTFIATANAEPFDNDMQPSAQDTKPLPAAKNIPHIATHNSEHINPHHTTKKSGKQQSAKSSSKQHSAKNSAKHHQTAGKTHSKKPK